MSIRGFKVSQKLGLAAWIAVSTFVAFYGHPSVFTRWMAPPLLLVIVIAAGVMAAWQTDYARAQRAARRPARLIQNIMLALSIPYLAILYLLAFAYMLVGPWEAAPGVLGQWVAKVINFCLILMPSCLLLLAGGIAFMLPGNDSLQAAPQRSTPVNSSPSGAQPASTSRHHAQADRPSPSHPAKPTSAPRTQSAGEPRSGPTSVAPQVPTNGHPTRSMSAARAAIFALAATLLMGAIGVTVHATLAPSQQPERPPIHHPEPAAAPAPPPPCPQKAERNDDPPVPEKWHTIVKESVKGNKPDPSPRRSRASPRP